MHLSPRQATVLGYKGAPTDIPTWAGHEFPGAIGSDSAWRA